MAAARGEIADEAPEISQITGNVEANAVDESESETETAESSDDGPSAGYEQLREQRIKENLARLQKLRISDLSLKLKAAISASSVRRAPRNLSAHRKTPLRSPLLVSEPPRRSSRLRNETPVSYTENVKLPKRERKQRRVPIYRDVGVRTEIYTEEHEKLLGSTELPWKLFVDGCGADGRRIYDSVRGKTCHQCRQKTLGHRTNCSNCQMVQGQFCGDCLYMRYGENVLEANKNPDWLCPVCRGICNCSLCRQAKGWPPTGTMYRMITSLGYKSVAHYLVQTRRAPPETKSEDKDQKTPHSAKRSLAFTDIESPADENQPQKKKISAQKLDYGEINETRSSGNKANLEASEEILEIGKAEFVAGRTRSSGKKANSNASEELLKTENEADFVAARTRSSGKKANPNVSEGILKTGKGGENEAVLSKKGLRKSKPCTSQGFTHDSKKTNPNVAARTRSSGKKTNPNVSEGILKIGEGGENEAVLSKKGFRKSKAYTSQGSTHDSIARRLRPRINRN